MISSVHQWIYFSLFYPVGTKSAMASPCHDEVIIDNTSTSVDFSAEAVAGASTSGLNSVKHRIWRVRIVLFHIWIFQTFH